MNEPTRVSYTLEEMFARLENKIDSLEDKLNNKIEKLDNKIDNAETKLNNKIEKLDNKIDKQSEEITVIKSTLQTQQQLIQKIPDLAEKVGELKNWRQIVVITITAIISGAITWVIRGGNLKP